MPVPRASQLRPLTWENLVVGEELGPIEAIVSDFKLKSHAYAVDDYGAWYFQESPFGGRIGHPTLLAEELLKIFTLRYDVKPPVVVGLHARNELELLQPIRVGQRVVLRGRHTDKYERDEQKYRVLEGEVLDEGGRVLVRQRATLTVGPRPAPRAGGTVAAARPATPAREVLESAPEVGRASRDTPVGAVLPPLAKQTSLEQSVAFSGFPYGWVEGGATEILRWFHTDADFARTQGLRDAVVAGLVTNAYMSELCTAFFGPSWLTTGRLSVAFVRPVYVRDAVTVSGMVRGAEVEEKRSRLHLDLWCKNQMGEVVVTGRASAEVE